MSARQDTYRKATAQGAIDQANGLSCDPTRHYGGAVKEDSAWAKWYTEGYNGSTVMGRPRLLPVAKEANICPLRSPEVFKPNNNKMKIKSRNELALALDRGPVGKDNVSKALSKVLERWQASKDIAVVGDHIALYGGRSHFRLLGLAAFREGIAMEQPLNSDYETGRAYKALWQHFNSLKKRGEFEERHDYWLQGWELGRAEAAANQNQ